MYIYWIRQNLSIRVGSSFKIVLVPSTTNLKLYQWLALRKRSINLDISDLDLIFDHPYKRSVIDTIDSQLLAPFHNISVDIVDLSVSASPCVL